MVKLFDPKKKVATIAPDNRGVDILADSNALRAAGFKRLEPGQRVTFCLSRVGGKIPKWVVTNLQVIEPEALLQRVR